MNTRAKRHKRQLSSNMTTAITSTLVAPPQPQPQPQPQPPMVQNRGPPHTIILHSSCMAEDRNKDYKTTTNTNTNVNNTSVLNPSLSGFFGIGMAGDTGSMKPVISRVRSAQYLLHPYNTNTNASGHLHFRPMAATTVHDPSFSAVTTAFLDGDLTATPAVSAFLQPGSSSSSQHTGESLAAIMDNLRAGQWWWLSNILVS